MQCTDTEICFVYGSLWRFVTQFSQSVILTRSGQMPSCGVGGRRGREVEDPVLLRYNTVSLGKKFHKFRIIIVALSWKVCEVRHSNSWHNDATLYPSTWKKARCNIKLSLQEQEHDCLSLTTAPFISQTVYITHGNRTSDVYSTLRRNTMPSSSKLLHRTRRSYVTRDLRNLGLRVKILIKY